MDVKGNAVCGDVLLPKGVSDAKDFRVGIVGISVLLVAQAPERGHLHTACQPGVGFDDIGYRAVADEIIVHFPTPGAEGGEAVVAGAEVKIRLIAVVEEDPILQAVVDAHVKRDGGIKGVLADAVAKDVRVPVSIGFSFPVKVAGLLSQPDETLALLKVPVGRHLRSDPGGAETGFVFIDGAVIGGVETDGKRLPGDLYIKAVGMEADLVGGLDCLEAGGR